VAVEAAVIVLSILLALGVDELREARRDRALELEYLTRLLDDLAENAEVLEGQRNSETAQIANARVVYPLVSRGEMDGVDTMTLVVASYNATPSPTPAWVDDTFEELKTTGRMSLIRSATLKGELLAYYRFLEARAYTYQLMSTEYRDALRARMDADLQLRIRQECRGAGNQVGCPVDIQSPDLPSFFDWLSANEELAGGLRKVIVQWTRGETEYLPQVHERTEGLRRIIEAELAR
jgi:hypothetical protein